MIEQGIEKTPISKDEWDSGRKWETPEARILLFLRKNRDKAFTLAEIIQGIGYITKWEDIWGLVGCVANLWTVQNALETLIKEATVKAKIIKKAIGDDTYYTAT